METTAYSLPEWINKAERYAAASEHCTYEMRLKLCQWGTPAEHIDAIIEHLIAQHFIDDSRYANAFLHDKLHFQHWGRNKINYALRGKGLDDAIIQQAWQSVDMEDYWAILHKVAHSKNAPREQQIRFLLQRGFTYEEIKKELTF